MVFYHLFCQIILAFYSIFFSSTYSSFIQPDNIVCFPDLSIDREIETYEWLKDGVLLSNDASFVYTPTEVGAQELEFRAINQDGIINSDTITVYVSSGTPEGPIANAGQDIYVKYGENVKCIKKIKMN